MAAELPLDAYYDMTTVTDVAVSPSGDRVAFVAHEFAPDEDERVPSLFVAPSDGGRDPHRLTRQPGVASPKWSPDGDRLAFLAARDRDVARRVGRDAAPDEECEDGDDESEAETQVWLFDLGLGGDARQVTERDDGVSEFDWSPDGDRLVVAARDPTEAERDALDEREDGGPIETRRLQHKVDGHGWLDTVTTYLFVVEVDSGEATRLDDASGGGAFESLTGLSPVWGSQDRIAFTACRLERPDDSLVRDIYTIAPDGSDLREHTDGTLSARSLAWSPDGERLAATVRNPANWSIPDQLYVLEGDSFESVTADLDRTLGWYAEPVWADDETLYTLVGDEGHTRLVRTDPDGNAVGVFDAQGRDRSMPRFDLAGGTAAAVLSDPGAGEDVFTVDAADLDAETPPDSLTRLTALQASIVDSYSMPQCRRVTWESDGWDVEGLVYLPPDHDPDSEDPLPVVVAIHGGPISYDAPVFDFSHVAFTTRGYAVFRPNYRGSSSYSRSFSEELNGAWGTAEVDDIAAGVESLVERDWVDPDRVFGHGFSYGGIAQGYLVTQTDLFTAAAPEHGIYDLRSAFGTDDSQVWIGNEFGLPWENPEAFERSSAITDAGDIDTPLLVMAGGEDWRCPPSQSEQFYVAARKQGVEAKLVVYPGENHSVTDPERAVHRLTEILDWYAEHDPARDED